MSGTSTIPEVLDEIQRELDAADATGFFNRIDGTLAKLRHIVEHAPTTDCGYPGFRYRVIYDGRDAMTSGEDRAGTICNKCGQYMPAAEARGGDGDEHA